MGYRHHPFVTWMWSHGGWNCFIRANENSYTTTRNDAENPVRTPQKTPVVLENQLILCQFLFGQKNCGSKLLRDCRFSNLCPIRTDSPWAQNGCGRLGWLGCTTRRFHPGTDESNGMYSNQTENWQHTETFVLIHAWRCRVEWMDGKVATHCESILEWDAPLLFGTLCCYSYLWDLDCRSGWRAGNANLCHVAAHVAGFCGNVWGPILRCREEPRSGTRNWKQVPVSKRYHIS